jgi:hypothetical protein
MATAAEFLDAPAAVPSAENFLDGPAAPKAADFLDADAGIAHQTLNAVREFGSAAGRYIFHGLQGLSMEKSRALADPVPELYQAQAEDSLLPADQQQALEQQRIAQLQAAAPAAQQTADYFGRRAGAVAAESGVDPTLAQTVPARLARAGGQAAVMSLESMIPGAGVPLMALHGSAAAEAEAKAAGQTDAQAESAAVRSAIGLAIFGGASWGAAKGVAKLLPAGSARLTKFVAQFAGQDTANEISSRAIAGWEGAQDAAPGKKVDAALDAMGRTTLEGSTLNAVFAGMGAAHNAGGSERPAAAGAREPVGLESVGVPKAEDFLDGTTPAAAGAAGPIPDARTETPAPEPPSPIDQTYAHLEEVKPEFDRVVRNAAGVTPNGKAMLTDLKGQDRVIEKASIDYGGDLSQVRDILRARILAPTADAMGRAAWTVGQNFPITRIKDTFSRPGNEGFAARFVNVDVGNGHQAEVQITTPAMQKAATEAHADYNEWRSIPRTGPEANPARVQELEARIKARFQPAWEDWRAAHEAQSASNSTRDISGSSSSLAGLDNGRGGSPEQLRAVIPEGPGTSATGNPSTSWNRVPGGNVTPESTPVGAPRQEPNHADYFNLDARTRTVPLDQLVPTKPAASQPKSVEKAAGFMRGAAAGGAKRDPITVRQRADGKFQIVDGNATYGAAEQFGWKDMPVRVEGLTDAAKAAAKAEAEYRRELAGEARAPQAGEGKELLQAIIDAGGLPAKGSPGREPWRGELAQLDEAVRKNANRTERIPANRLFRATAADVDELAVFLRDHGFGFQRPDELIDAVSERIRTGRPQYGMPARESLAHDGFHLRARAGHGGFVNLDLLEGAADFGRRVLQHGMDFASWARDMVRHLGEKILPHLEGIWNSISGANFLPHAQERGGAYRGPSKEDFERAANDPSKMREHVETVQRMTEVTPDVKQRVESWYTPVTLKEVQDRANAAIDKAGLGKATDLFMRSRTTDADTMALGHNVALRLDQLQRYDEAAMVRDAMAERLTSPAQALWFISTIGKTSPEGLIRTAQKLVTDQIAADPEKVKLLEEINRLKAELAKLPEGPTREAATKIVIQNLSRVDKPGQRLTSGQLEKLLAKHDAGELGPEDLAAALAKHLKIPRLTPDNIIKIKHAQKAWNDATDPIVKMRRGGRHDGCTVYGLVPRGVLGEGARRRRRSR